jgi:hypothetical protein
MTFSVQLEPCEGLYAATLVGAPEVRVIATTRDEAISALKGQIAQRVAQGELFSLEVGSVGIAELAGKYADDPSIRQICAFEKIPGLVVEFWE